jgi:hypothetical protein
MKKTGIIIILLGLALTIVTTIALFTNEKVISIGKFEIIRNIPHYLIWSPIISVAILAFGWIVYGQSTKKD